MGKKLWSAGVVPLHDWLLIRVAEARGELIVAEAAGPKGQMKVTQGLMKKNHGIVVAKGPGHRKDNGDLVPIDASIAVGATVLFMGGTAQRPEDFMREMEEEGVWFVPAEAAVAVLRVTPSYATVQA